MKKGKALSPHYGPISLPGQMLFNCGSLVFIPISVAAIRAAASPTVRWNG